MNTRTYFEQIEVQLLKELDLAQESIYFALAWSTNGALINKLCEKCNRGLSVELLVFDNQVNNADTNDLEKLQNAGGKLYKVELGRYGNSTRLDEFCVIDHTTVISSVYPWRHMLQFEELIVSYKALDLAAQFIKEFQRLKTICCPEERAAHPLDLRQVIKRLSLIRHLIELDEQEGLPLHVAKLPDLDEDAELTAIVQALRAKQFGTVLPAIEAYTQSRNQLDTYMDPEIEGLRVEAKSLVIQLAALDNEHNELEHMLYQFHARHTQELGPLIIQILKLKAENAKTETEKEEAETDSAAYEEGCKPHMEVAAHVHTEEWTEPLQLLYRQASKPRQPDIVATEHQAEAGKWLVELKDAYARKDRHKVQEIMHRPQQGMAWGSELERLRTWVSEYRLLVRDRLQEIEAVKHRNEYKTLYAIAERDAYFVDTKMMLEKELKSLKDETISNNVIDKPTTEATDILLTTVEQAFMITNKLLTPLIRRNRREVLDLLIWFDAENIFDFTNSFSADILSLFYPINIELINQYSNYWNWDFMSSNNFINWNEELLAQYEDNWDWKRLTRNPAVMVNSSLIDRFKDKWDWSELSNGNASQWLIRFAPQENYIDCYKDKWDWNLLSNNHRLPWSEELIERFKENWNWYVLSNNRKIPWNHDFIDRYKNKWRWDSNGYSRNMYHGIVINKQWNQNLVVGFHDRFSRSEWSILSGKELDWNADFIERFEDKLDWSILSSNITLPWSEALIERFRNMWDWARLAGNSALPWSEALIDQYRDKWELRESVSGRYGWQTLSGNESVPWNEDLIDRYIDKWYWSNSGKCLSRIKLPWSIALIERYSHKLDWNILSINKHLPWTEELIDCFTEKWNWHILNPHNLIWTENIIDRYADKWNWHILSSHSLPWCEELIERHKDKWYWHTLSLHESLPWSMEFIDRYKDKWSKRLEEEPDWKKKEEDTGLVSGRVWRYQERRWSGLQGDVWEGLSENKALPWTDDLIDRFWGWWDWDVLSKHEFLPWSVELIERHKHLWNWGILSGNKSLPWSVDLIMHFSDKWVWHNLTEYSFIYDRIVKPHADDALVDEVMRRISGGSEK